MKISKLAFLCAISLILHLLSFEKDSEYYLNEISQLLPQGPMPTIPATAQQPSRLNIIRKKRMGLENTLADLQDQLDTYYKNDLYPDSSAQQALIFNYQVLVQRIQQLKDQIKTFKKLEAKLQKSLNNSAK